MGAVVRKEFVLAKAGSSLRVLENHESCFMTNLTEADFTEFGVSLCGGLFIIVIQVVTMVMVNHGFIP